MSDEKTSDDKAKADDDAAAKAAPKADTTAPEPTDAPKGDAGDEGESDEGAEENSASPEAIAKRVAALGEEDALDRIAAEEERKLAERKAARKGKKKGGGGGLEVAASKKLQKIGTRAEPKRTVAVAADADPLIERTTKLSEWAKQNQKTVQIVGALIAAALLGIAGFLYLESKHETDASVLLTKAVEDEHARIGEPPKDDEKDKDPYQGAYYKTYEDRREAALKKYREVQSQFPKTGAAILARLAEASLLLDKREADKAIAAFTEVKASPLAMADQEVKGRCIEGIGFGYELKAQATPAEKDKNLDEALKAYKELENTLDVKGFKELAMYHQARVLDEKGDKDKAKEILLSLKERFTKPEDNPLGLPLGPSFPYLREAAMDRLRTIDPSAAPKAPAGGMNNPGGARSLSPEQIRKMIEDAQKKAGGGGKGGHP